MRFSRALRVIAFTGLLGGLPSLAWAEGPDEEGRRAEAKARYEQAVEAYKKDRFKDAIDLFLEADHLAPSAPLSFNIARCYGKIGDDAGALHWYRDYLRRDPNAKNSSDVHKLVQGLETSLAKKGVQQVTVLSTPPGATVAIDGRPVGVTPYTAEFAPGQHQLGLSLRGYADNQQRFDLPADHAGDVVVRLVPGSGPAAPPAPLAPTSAPAPAVITSSPSESGAPPGPSAQGFGPWPWVSLAIGTAALGGSVGFELSRRSAEDAAKSEVTQVGYRDKLDAMNSHQTVARVLVGAGGAFVAAGTVLLILNPRAAKKERATVGVWCVPKECGLGAQGRF